MTAGELITYLETLPADTLLVRFDDGTQAPNERFEPMAYPEPITVYRPTYSPRYFRRWTEERPETGIVALVF